MHYDTIITYALLLDIEVLPFVSIAPLGIGFIILCGTSVSIKDIAFHLAIRLVESSIKDMTLYQSSIPIEHSIFQVPHNHFGIQTSLYLINILGVWNNWICYNSRSVMLPTWLESTLFTVRIKLCVPQSCLKLCLVKAWGQNKVSMITLDTLLLEIVMRGLQKHHIGAVTRIDSNRLVCFNSLPCAALFNLIG